MTEQGKFPNQQEPENKPGYRELWSKWLNARDRQTEREAWHQFREKLGGDTERRLQEARETVKNAGSKAGEAVESSRESRLKAEKEDEEKNAVQKFFSNGCMGTAATTLIQAIPAPTFLFWGPGDAVTAISAGLGRDILTGNKLDKFDRWVYVVASIFPWVPATVLVGPARAIRRHIEEANHAHRSGNPETRDEHLMDMVKEALDLRKGIKGARGNKDNEAGSGKRD